MKSQHGAPSSGTLREIQAIVKVSLNRSDQNNHNQSLANSIHFQLHLVPVNSLIVFSLVTSLALSTHVHKTL